MQGCVLGSAARRSNGDTRSRHLLVISIAGGTHQSELRIARAPRHGREGPGYVTVAIRCFCAGLGPASGVKGRRCAASDCNARTSGTAYRSKRMQQQPESSSSTLTVSPAPLPGTASDTAPGSASAPQTDVHPPHQAPRWLESLELFVRVMLRMYIGLALCYAPWSGQVLRFLPWSHTLWDQNPLWELFPPLADIAANGAVRGIVSGLGLLNLWIAFHDAIRHRDG